MPRIIIVRTHDRKIFFESLTQAINLAYVRTRAAELNVPFSPAGLKKAMLAMPDVFAWRDTVILRLKRLHTPITIPIIVTLIPFLPRLEHQEKIVLIISHVSF